jgi:anthranilate synthase/aminodeoxychorismate synthase-like glutamine amidotransferase
LRALCFANDLKSKIIETPENALPAREAALREPERVRILVVDNYDSFTYNLVQLIETLGADVEVVRNDAASASALAARCASGVVLSPGPGAPDRAGATLAVVERCAADAVPVLGVCLGHQAIGVAFGARMRRARVPRHGKTAPMRHDGAGVFAGVPDPTPVALYHSLVIDELPDALCPTAHGPECDVMGVRHRALPLEGVQFHPESVLMPACGTLVVRNFLARCGASA